MGIKIFVDNYDGGPVATNTTLTGTIAVELRKAEQRNLITQVQLVFYGRSKVDITRTRNTGAGNNRHTTHDYYHSKCILFSHSFSLTTNTFEPAASRRGEDGGTLNFLFSVHIPTHAEPVPPNIIEVHGGDVLNYSDMFPGTLGYDPPHAVQPPLPLPDTMLDFHDHVSNAHRVTANAQVRYTLRAEAPGLSSASKLWMGDAEEDCDIAIFNPVSFATAPVINFNQMCYDETVRTLRLLPSHSGKEHRLSFRENMRSVFKKDRLPFFTLRMGMSVPDTLWLDKPDDEPLSIYLNVQRLLAGLGEGETSAGGSRSRSRSRSRGKDESPLPSGGFDWNEEKSLPSTDAKSPYLAPPNTQPQPDDGIPDPEVVLTRFSLALSAHTSLRGNNPSPSSWGGQTYHASPSVRIFEWRASKTSPQIPLSLISSSSASPVPPPNQTYGSTNTSTWVDLGSALGMTTEHLRSAGSISGLGANSDGSLQGSFTLPNFARQWSVSWDLRMEVAGEEVRWRCDDDGDAGVGVKLYRGDGGQNRGTGSTQQDAYSQQQQQPTYTQRSPSYGDGGYPTSAPPPSYIPREDESSGSGLQEKMARLSVGGGGSGTRAYDPGSKPAGTTNYATDANNDQLWEKGKY